MIQSMTGYGKAETILEAGKLTIEIKSLNGKNADISIKTALLPKDKELAVRQLIAQTCSASAYSPETAKRKHRLLHHF